MYDPRLALQGIDLHTTPIMICLLVTVFAAFLYFAIAFRMAVKQKVYVVPFIGAALFFWHDLTFVLLYDQWFNLYNHWWVKMWWFALVGTVIFELLMIWQANVWLMYRLPQPVVPEPGDVNANMNATRRGGVAAA